MQWPWSYTSTVGRAWETKRARRGGKGDRAGDQWDQVTVQGIVQAWGWCYGTIAAQHSRIFEDLSYNGTVFVRQ